MRKLLIVSLSIFIIGVIFRFLHWPGASFMAMLSVFLIFIFTLINSFTRKKAVNLSILEGWLLFAWATNILFKYLYWETGPALLGLSIMFLTALSLTVIYIIETKSQQVRKLSKAIVLISAFGYIFNFIPAYSICYVFDINEVLNKERNETSYYSWDKYSWFLYIRAKKEQSLAANQKAIDAWHKYDSIYGANNPEDSLSLQLLNDHRQGIITGSWTGAFVRHPATSPR